MVSLFMVISLNGYIARDNGEEDFLSHENWKTFVGLVNKCGCFIYGRKTYEAVRTWGEEYLEDLKHAEKVVVTTTHIAVDEGWCTTCSPKDAIRVLRDKGYKNIVLSGGSSNNASFLKEKLVDEVILNIEPYLIGKGIPLFAKEEFENKLKLKNMEKISDEIIQLNYDVLYSV